MEEYKEFELGDMIPKDEVYTAEGSAKYQRMARFCNENGYVMKESTIEGSSEYPAPIEVYVIAEADSVKKPTAVEQARAEHDACRMWFREVGGHDDMAIKCSVLGLSFKDEYPGLYEEGIRKRARINELERTYNLE